MFANELICKTLKLKNRVLLKRTSFVLLAGLIGLFPAAGRMVSSGEPADTAHVEVKGDALVQEAMKYLGVRYRAGASGPKYFDCSGFTSYIYRKNNLNITRSSRSQYQEGTPVKRIADLKPGDLVFFSGSRSSRTVGHVGIVKEVSADSSDFSFVHASRTGVKVDVMSSDYYKKRYLGARRVL